MRVTRLALPADLLALAVASGRSYRNEARPRERLSDPDDRVRPFGTAMEPWLSLRNNRGVWIASRGQKLQGMVAARPSGSRQAWEIDCLIDASSESDVMPGLLEKAIVESGKAGAHKVFLRLNADSPLLKVARAVGFQAYQEEVLYVREPDALPTAPNAKARPFSRLDLYPSFRLYNRVTPESVRRSEAVTFGEWQAAQSNHWLREGSRVVLESEDGVGALLRFARSNGDLLFDLLIDPEYLDEVPSLVALAGQGQKARLLCLVPTFAESLSRRLEGLDFAPASEFVSLYHRTARPVKSGRKLVPAVAKSAVAP